MPGTRYDIDIRANASDAERAAMHVDALSAALTGAGAASAQAAQGVAAASASYKQAEASAARAAAAAETMSAAVAKQQAIVTAANAALQSTWSPALVAKAEAYEAKLAALTARQAEATAAVAATSEALAAEAAALDAANASATAAAESQRTLAAQIAAAKQAAADADADALAASQLQIAESAYYAGETERQLASRLRDAQTAVEAANQAHAASEAAFQAAADAAARETAALIASEQAFYNDGAAADALATSHIRAAEAAYEQAEGERKLAEQLTAAQSGAASAKKRTEDQKKANDAMKAAGNEMREMRGHAQAGMKVAFGMVAAIAAITIGFLAGAYAIGSWALELADANRTAKMGAKDELSLSKQSEKLKKNLAATFGGLKIDGLLKGLSTMVNLLDANTASGRFLKFVFEGVFQPFIDAAANAIPKVERLLLGVAIGALKFYISIKPAIAALKEMGVIDTGSWPDVLAVGKIAGQALAAALGAVVIVIGAIVGAFYLMHQAVGAVLSIGPAIRDAIGGAFDYVAGLSFADLGMNLIHSLANAITSGGPAVIAAITGVAASTIAAAKAALGIASPSKPMAAMGDNVAGTFTNRIDAGTDDAQSAMADLVAPPTAKAATGAGAKAGRAGGMTLTIEEMNIYGDDAKGSVRQQVFDALDEYVAGASLALGGGEAAAA